MGTTGRGGSPHEPALAVLARAGHIAAIEVLKATMLDHGAAVLDHWDNQGIHEESWASINCGDFVRDAAPASARHRTTITLSLDLRKRPESSATPATVPPVLRPAPRCWRQRCVPPSSIGRW